jgi:16S rRNA (uracil1498-N3)-methyltransferase
MNRLLLVRGEVDAAGHCFLPGEDPRARHLDEVLRPQPGTRLRAGLINGPRGEVEVEGRSGEGWRLRFLGGGESDPPAPWTLLLALPRPQTLRKVLALAAPLGLRRLLLVGAARTEKAFYHSPLLAGGEWRRHLRSGMEQAGVVQQPQVLLFGPLHRLLEVGLETWLPAEGPRLLPHPGGGRGLEALAGCVPRGASLAVGPEGGWLPGEVTAFEARGFRQVDLGPRILRVETAVCHLCAQLELLARLHPTGDPAT